MQFRTSLQRQLIIDSTRSYAHVDRIILFYYGPRANNNVKYRRRIVAGKDGQ
jgi:lipoprotein NlpI